MLGLGRTGHHHKLCVPVLASGRLGLPKSILFLWWQRAPSALMERVPLVSSCWKALVCHRVLQICQRKKERGGDEELYVTWADEAPDVSLPFGTPSPPGCLTEHCNSWHCL